MKYICLYKTDVKCDMVRFDTLVKFGKLISLKILKMKMEIS